MKKHISTLVLLAILVVIGVLLWRRFHPNEKAVVAQRVASLAEYATKPSGEGNAAMAVKMTALNQLLADEVEIDLRGFPFNGKYAGGEFYSEIVRGRAMCDTLTLAVHDIQVVLDDPATATATFTARLDASARGGGGESETREIHATLRKVDGKWVFTSFREEAVLVK